LLTENFHKTNCYLIHAPEKLHVPQHAASQPKHHQLVFRRLQKPSATCGHFFITNGEHRVNHTTPGPVTIHTRLPCFFYPKGNSRTSHSLLEDFSNPNYPEVDRKKARENTYRKHYQKLQHHCSTNCKISSVGYIIYRNQSKFNDCKDFQQVCYFQGLETSTAKSMDYQRWTATVTHISIS